MDDDFLDQLESMVTALRREVPFARKCVRLVMEIADGGHESPQEAAQELRREMERLIQEAS